MGVWNLAVARYAIRCSFLSWRGNVKRLSGVVGSLVGLGLAWFISMDSRICSLQLGPGNSCSEWTWSSLFAGWAWGFSSPSSPFGERVWTARTNIVVALRGGRSPIKLRVSWLLVLTQILELVHSAFPSWLCSVFPVPSPTFLGGLRGLHAHSNPPFFTVELPSMLKHRHARDNLHRHAGRTPVPHWDWRFLSGPLALRA